MDDAERLVEEKVLQAVLANLKTQLDVGILVADSLGKSDVAQGFRDMLSHLELFWVNSFEGQMEEKKPAAVSAGA